VLPYFSATEHHVQQTGVAAASSLIVFFVNLSGITGIVPMVINGRKNDRYYRVLVQIS
jgi:hypothetical protein